MHALFINDLGFQYGAGIAHLRQIQSFLAMGWDVSALCWNSGSMQKVVPFTFPYMKGRWLGLEELPYLHIDAGVSDAFIIDTLINKIKVLSPDVVITGNIHAAKWPIALLKAISSLRCKLVVFMHDCYWFTGRCAYTGSCDLHRIGCNHNCPTWEQYPPLQPDLIFDAWFLRRQMFCGVDGIPIVTDSQWLLNQLRQSMPSVTSSECIYYGLDENLFKPLNKKMVRKILGLPLDSFIVLGGAVNLTDYRKGGHIFQKLFSLFKGQDDVCFLTFGVRSDNMPGAYSTGLLRDYRKMPLVYNAADIFVNTSLEEAFGQTMCEASACEVPVVAFSVGGVPEIARHGINARLVSEQNEKALAEEVNFFKSNIGERVRYGKSGRLIVEKEFTILAQGERWVKYLERI